MIDTENKAAVHIRWMQSRDMDDVLAIEEQSFEFMWNMEDFLRALRQRNCIGMVAEHGERIVGFMVYELEKNKLELMNLAVHPQWRRLGVGGQMVAKLIGKLGSHRRNRITVNLRETNTPAQLFFHQQGFLALRVLRNHFLDSSEDAFRFVYRLKGEAS